MASNFMKKVKTPKPVKPIKAVKPVNPITEVEEIKQPKIAEEKIEEIVETPVAEEIQEVEETPQEIEQVEEVVAESEPESKATEEAEPELEVEEPKPKAKKKSTKKKKEPVVAKENKETIGIQQAEEIMIDSIMPCSEGWNEEKERINGMLDKIVITEELDPTSIKALLADMSSALRELIMLAQESKTSHSNLKDIMESVKAENYTGANSEERKLNANHAMRNYEKDGQIVDLTELARFYREREDFYEAAVKQIEINRQMLITFGSVFKIELAKAY